MEIDLKKLGQHTTQTPNSLALCLDFISIWGSDPNRAQLGRLCAAAIGVCVDHAKCLPAYKTATGDPINYGFKIMDRLLQNNVSPGYVYEIGSKLLTEMMEKIPTDREVEETANFT